MALHEAQLFDGWAPELTLDPALWPPVDPSEVDLDEQARWIWPNAVGPAGTGWGAVSGWNEPGSLPGANQGWSA